MTRTQQRWTAADVPEQHGRTTVITGANTGIGYQAAKVLAEQGATVVLACRNLTKAGEAAARIKAGGARGSVEVVHLDLGSLASVRRAAAQLRDGYPRLDLLINNAGVMIPPYGRTEDGFELQFGTNHLGHFALTGLLLDRLVATPGSRIVTISSVGHRRGVIDFDDLQFERGYRPIAAYGQSKLANLLFTYDLQRRLAAAGSPTVALAAHPGGSRTELQRHAAGWLRVINTVLTPLMQDSAAGALPTLRAATDPDAQGGEYYGPAGRFEVRGYPVRVGSNARSHDVEVAHRLWEASERLTGIAYQLPAVGVPARSPRA